MEKREFIGDAAIVVGIAIAAYALMLVYPPLGIGFVGCALVVAGFGLQAGRPALKPGERPADAHGPFEPGTAKLPRERRRILRRPARRRPHDRIPGA